MTAAAEVIAKDALAEAIRQRHEFAEEAKKLAADGITHAMQCYVETSQLVEALKNQTGNRFRQFWRDHQLPAGWDAKYLRLARTAKRLPDKDQLRLIGIIPEAEDHHQNQQSQAPNPFAWVKWANKASSELTPERIERMDSFERRSAMERIKPLVDIYERLKAAV